MTPTPPEREGEERGTIWRCDVCWAMTDDIGAFPVCDHDADDYGPWVSAARLDEVERERDDARERAGCMDKMTGLERTLSLELADERARAEAAETALREAEEREVELLARPPSSAPAPQRLRRSPMPDASSEEPLAFQGEEVEALREIVVDWIGEGFTIPPYTDAQYTIFEKLGLDEQRPTLCSYDTRRPSDPGGEV